MIPVLQTIVAVDPELTIDHRSGIVVAELLLCECTSWSPLPYHNKDKPMASDISSPQPSPSDSIPVESVCGTNSMESMVILINDLVILYCNQ